MLTIAKKYGIIVHRNIKEVVAMSDSLRIIRSFLLKFVVIYIVYRLINLLVLEVLYNVGLQTYVEIGRASCRERV